MYILKFMELLATYRDSFSRLIQRLWWDGIRHPLVLGLAVVILALNASTAANPVPSAVKFPTPQPQQLTTTVSPPSPSARERLRHRLVTGATMTGHSLTDSHLFNRRPTDKLAATNHDKSKQG